MQLSTGTLSLNRVYSNIPPYSSQVNPITAAGALDDILTLISFSPPLVQ